MPWDARGTIALLISALVGIAAGVTLGISTGSAGSPAKGPGGRTGSPSASAGSGDPLGLGIPLQNLPCSGGKILVVGYGDSADGEMYNAASTDEDAKYLETAKSCNTLYGELNQVPPTYVVYLGPFDSTKDACAEQMTPLHSRDTVTNVKSGVKVHVPCLCVLEPATFPRLKPGMDATTRDGVYIKALQQLLADIDLLGRTKVTGRYDKATAKVIGQLQALNAITPKTPKTVDVQTWLAVRDRGCLSYEFS
jgi:hypothetical protein